MTDDDRTVPLLTLTDDQIVTRRRALGMAAVAVGVAALAATPAWADSEEGDAATDTESDAAEADTDADAQEAENDNAEMNDESGGEEVLEEGESDGDGG